MRWVSAEYPVVEVEIASGTAVVVTVAVVIVAVAELVVVVAVLRASDVTMRGYDPRGKDVPSLPPDLSTC